MSARLSVIGFCVPSMKVSPAGSLTMPGWLLPAEEAGVGVVGLVAFPAIVVAVEAVLPGDGPVVVDEALDVGVAGPCAEPVVGPAAGLVVGLVGWPARVVGGADELDAPLVAVVPDPRRLVKCPPASTPPLVELEVPPAATRARVSRPPAAPEWA